jgi:hypothetical protein
VSGERVLFAAGLASALAALTKVICGASLSHGDQVTWLVIAAVWIGLAWRFWERLDREKGRNRR